MTSAELPDDARERLDAITQLACALQDYLPGDAWHLAHAIKQVASGEITPAEALADDTD